MPKLPLSRVIKRLSLPDSDVWKVHYDAVERKANGEDILLLSVGDPDFNTPRYISDYVIDRINAGRTHYSPAAGELELRQAIADLEHQNTGHPISPNEIVIFPGATAALYATFASIANEGDSVLVPEPMYVGHQSVFTSLGLEVLTAPLAPPTFELDIDVLLGKRKANTKAVLVNTPGNPCGNIIPQAKLAELAQRCAAENLWLICDEVYSLITFERSHVSLLNSAADLTNVVVIDGLSKSHAMTGWRVGWVVCAPPFSEALTKYSAAALFGVSQFIQDGAAFALANDAADVERMRSAYQDRRDYVVSRLRGMQALSYFQPEGGMFVMINGASICPTGEQFASLLLRKAGISTIPGAAFGPSAADYVRLSLTQEIPILADAMDRIQKIIE